MKIILLGADGMLGQAVIKQMCDSHELHACDLPDYDIRDCPAFVKDLERTEPDAVINTAAYTLVDDAEDNPELVMEINGHAPGELARACSERGIPFVHISTDYVFDGTKDSPYLEDDPTNPISVYGKSKLVSEEKVAAAHPDGHIILRTSWLFGAGGKNFVSTMIGKWKENITEFRVVADQKGRPTYTIDLARAINACLEKGVHGTYHACNRGETNWHEFAKKIFEIAGAGKEVRVEPVSSDQYKTKAKRPVNSVMDTSKLEREAGFVFPHHADAVARYLSEAGFISDPGA